MSEEEKFGGNSNASCASQTMQVNGKSLFCGDVLNVREAARYVRCSPSKIYDMVKRNAIPFSRIEGRIVFVKSEVLDWVKSLSANEDSFSDAENQIDLFEEAI